MTDSDSNLGKFSETAFAGRVYGKRCHSCHCVMGSGGGSCKPFSPGMGPGLFLTDTLSTPGAFGRVQKTWRKSI